MPKLHICHLSVLNPIHHTRIFFKLAWTQAKLGCKVSILAQAQKGHQWQITNIQTYPQPTFSRLSIRRLLTPFIYLRKALKRKADVYTIHTPELLLTALLLKALRPSISLIYDVHEDYAKNIQFAGYYPKAIRFLAKAIRVYEKFAIRFFDYVTYAEYCYHDILNAKQKAYILRNSFTNRPIAHTTPQTPIPSRPYLLYTGTIAENWGIKETLKLWIEWNKHQEILLIVAGFAPQPQILTDIQQQVEAANLSHNFQLIGGNTYLPYTEIIHLIKHCWLGLALYKLRPNIKGKIPTKFYEFMANKKPLLFTNDPQWIDFNQKYPLGFPWQNQTLSQIQTAIQSFKPHQGKEAYWTQDEQTLQAIIQQIQSKKTND